MKKVLIILAIIFTVIIGLIIAVPYLFKDDIIAAIEKEIDKNIKADVYFDADKVGISIFKQFPNLTLTLEDFGIVGIGEFSEDTLTAVDAFDITINLKSVISGNQIQIKSINLDNPRVMVLVMKDGTANYDIVIESQEDSLSESDQDKKDETQIGIDSWRIQNGNIAYYDQSSNLIIAVEGLNHSGSGDFTMDVFDINTNTTVEDLLIRFEDITYIQDKKIEAEVLVNMDLEAARYTLKDNRVVINDFSIGFNGYIEMLKENYNIDISYEGLDNSIKSLLSLIPGAYKEGYEDISADGSFSFNGYVKGIYSEENNQIPAFQVKLIAENGTIQYPDLPEAIKNINLDLLVNNEGTAVDQTTLDMKKIHLEFGKNPVDATFKLKNLINYDMVADIKAHLNLDDMTKIYPLKDTELSGDVKLDIHIDGVYDSINQTIPLSGKVDINQLNYAGPDIPKKFGIHSTSAELNARQINVRNFSGFIGNTDLNLSGYLQNYMAYLMKENELLKGDFDFRSKQVDLNEWMTQEDSTQLDQADTSELQVIKVPENINFVLKSEMDKVYYDNLELNDVKGNLYISDGIVRLEKLDFNTLGGDFVVSGTYNTQNIDHPKFNFNLSINKLSIPKAYKAFFTIKQFAPIANLMDGDFSTDFNLSGELKQNMMPNLMTLTGSGLLEILNAAVKGSESKVISGITNLTKLSGESAYVTLRDVIMSTQIIDGRVLVEPFTINFGNNKAVIAGSNGLDGSLDYKLKLDVPPGAVQTATSLVSSAIGQDLNVNSKDVKLNLGIGGTYDNPKISILGAETGGTEEAAKEALKAVVEEEKEKLTEEAEKKLDEETDKALEKTDELIQNEKVKEEVDKAKEQLKKLFKKKGG